jgi:hypothetical protein
MLLQSWNESNWNAIPVRVTAADRLHATYNDGEGSEWGQSHYNLATHYAGESDDDNFFPYNQQRDSIIFWKK